MARGRGRGKARGRGGRGRKATRVISSDEEESVQETQKESTAETEAGPKDAEKMEVDEQKVEANTTEEQTGNEPEENRQTFDMEADISQLEAPTFTTISRGPPEPMLHLTWNHKVNLIGEKVLNPMIYCCDQCEKPILVYGRMIPCKHVFCLKCARNETLKVCPRCKEKAIRVEQTGLGTIFMCTHGGTRYESKGCRRTYLSQRDLQAHINHRHVSTPAVARLESLAVKVSEPDCKAASSNPSIVSKKATTGVRTPSQVRSNSQSDSEYTRGPGTPTTNAAPPESPQLNSSTPSLQQYYSPTSTSYFGVPPPMAAPVYGIAGMPIPPTLASAQQRTPGATQGQNFFGNYPYSTSTQSQPVQSDPTQAPRSQSQYYR